MQKRKQTILIVLAISGLGIAIWLANQTRPTADPDVKAPRGTAAAPPNSLDAALPPIANSRFTNTSSQTQFIGGAACAECHPTQRDSYLQTPHSRALGDVDVQREGGRVAFDHPRSNRSYEVLTKNKQVWHRETLRGKDGQHLLLAEYPIHWTIGSGNHSRSYLVETEGFLLESPVTWYTSKQKWDMSPGYESAHAPGFERLADVGCVFCHAGRVESVDGNRNRVKIHEQSIGCESCHGPGALHAARHAGDPSEVAGEDLTIVNPAHLTRTQREAICAQCHLRGDASVALRGRSVQSFRPGLRLNDFRADYVLEQPDESMKVVGHVEQMRLSRCYQESESMTCTTCHDPHNKPPSVEKVEHYRQTCLACHTIDTCGLTQQQRLARDAEDNCAACHMPQSPTDIPHFAFTHHRIGLHRDSAERGATAERPSPPPAVSRLIPLHDLSHLPEVEQARCLGLANLELSDKQTTAESHTAYRLEAIRLLEQVHQVGLQDGDVESTLARIYWEQGDLRQAIRLASQALQYEGTSGAVTNALFVLGDSYVAMNQPALAIPFLKKLTTRRRQSEDWLLLGVCERSTGQIDAAIRALEQAVKISPVRLDARAMLAELYEIRGNSASAALHRQVLEVQRPMNPVSPGSSRQEPKIGPSPSN